ncbi:hypothetical protein GALMADRAFT_148608 [Galerina marginata CBS 339.88]|uniref:Uncharacterized protein n=1 Tax=Galerina marginata (strain CBS 339.88) TaxID=685588 RepID=A0A067SFL4_GALM3|nr:hypothetical protein GALMADRAFT_148608 [Galerina marginata CBS 339.88]
MTAVVLRYHYPPRPHIGGTVNLKTRADVTQGTSAEPASQEINRRRLACRRYYERHKDKLQVKARERAAHAKKQRQLCETPAESAARKLRHREAAARHRENKRLRQLALVTKNACARDASVQIGT